MTILPTLRVRLFSPDEFSAPEGWPEDVGIAVLQTGSEPEIFPVHQTERPASILSRIQAQSARDLSTAAVFPALDGHPDCDLSFTAVAKLRGDIEAFLSRTPAAVEEAADFAVNFGFAADEGLDPTALVRGPGAGEASSPPESPAAAPVVEELPGYAPFDPELTTYRKSITATLWLSPSGELIIVSDPDEDPCKLEPSNVLVREDGLALALRRSDPGLKGELPGYILLPPGCLGFDPPTSGLQVLIMPTERHYLVTPMLDWPEPSLTADPPLPVAREETSGRLQFLPLLLGALACITIGLAAALVLDGDAKTVAEATVGPFPDLRAQLFD